MPPICSLMRWPFVTLLLISACFWHGKPVVLQQWKRMHLRMRNSEKTAKASLSACRLSKQAYKCIEPLDCRAVSQQAIMATLILKKACSYRPLIVQWQESYLKLMSFAVVLPIASQEELQVLISGSPFQALVIYCSSLHTWCIFKIPSFT